MVYDRNKHDRRSIRLKGYDYAQAGAYFVTICTQHQGHIFGKVVNEEMRLNAAGRLVQSVWDGLPMHYPHVELDAFVIMPNHIHGVVVLTTTVGAGFKPAPTIRHGLPEVIRSFKTFSARRINEIRNATGMPIWQRNYHEHIIRDEESLNRIRQYILDNPANWAVDRENPAATVPEPEQSWRL